MYNCVYSVLAQLFLFCGQPVLILGSLPASVFPLQGMLSFKELPVVVEMFYVHTSQGASPEPQDHLKYG